MPWTARPGCKSILSETSPAGCEVSVGGKSMCTRNTLAHADKTIQHREHFHEISQISKWTGKSKGLLGPLTCTCHGDESRTVRCHFLFAANDILVHPEEWVVASGNLADRGVDQVQTSRTHGTEKVAGDRLCRFSDQPAGLLGEIGHRLTSCLRMLFRKTDSMTVTIDGKT